MAAPAPEESVRVDVWLWRARFLRSRGSAARLAEAGHIRLTRGDAQTRLDKASRLVRPGDQLVFALGGRLTAVRIMALGRRRGPPAEARALYAPLDAPAVPLGTCGIDKNRRAP